MTDNAHFDSLTTQLKIVKDRVRGVVHRKHTGLYLYGRAGTGKTYTVRSLLDRLAVNHTYSSGHLTPIGLFDLIQANQDRVIVLDDVSSIFNQPIALQLLLAALGNPHDDSGIRSQVIRENHPNLKLNLDLEAMSADERKDMAAVLQHVLARVSGTD